VKKLLSPVLFCSLFLLAACGNDDLSFRPSQGDSRQYQLHSSVQIELEAGGHRRELAQRTAMILTYEVESLRPHLSMRVRADHLQVRMPGLRFSSAEPGEGEPAAVRELFAEGFQIDVDPDSGRLLDFRGRHREHWQALLAERGEGMVEALRKQLETPGVLTAIPARVGAEVRLAGFQGNPELLLRVERVDAQELLASLQMQGEQGRAQGYLLLERDGGWLKRMALVSEQPFRQQGLSGTSRAQVLMMPVEAGLTSLDAYEWGETDPQGFVFPPWEEQRDELPAQVDAQQVFPSELGELSREDGQLRLSYEHGLSGGVPGELVWRDLRLRDVLGQSIDLQLLGGAPATFAGLQPGELAQTHASYLPLGWVDVQDRLGALQEVLLQADFFPYRQERLTLAVDPVRASRLERDGAAIELTPTGEPGEYLLAFSAGGGAFFSMAVEGLAGAQGWLHPEPPPAEWLTADEARLLRSVTGAGGWRYRVRFAEPPAELGVHLLRRAARPAFSRELQFIPAAALYGRSDVAPAGSFYLYAEPQEAAEPLDPLRLELEDVALNRLRLTLPREQAALCRLRLLQPASEAGRPLTWMPAEAEPDYSGGRQLPRNQQWQLRTADGVRQYFYDLELHSQLSCSGRARWQPVEMELGERPWLVDPRRLPGYAEAAPQRAASFLQRYRFLDRSGQALALLPPTAQQLGLDIGIAMLDEYLTDEGLLRLAGRVVRVERLESDGEAFERTWTTRLAPLP